MNGTEIIYLLLAAPLFFAILSFLACLLGKMATGLATLLNFIGILILLILCGLVVYVIFCDGQILSTNLWWHVDSLSGIFIAILGIIGFITGIYSIGYINHEVRHGEISVRGLCCYYGFFHLFLFTMLLAITTNNLIVMWVAIEATTLSSTFLVGLYGQKSSLEAAWKYIIICTIGVAFGLYGTVLVYADAASLMTYPSQAVFWTEVVKHPGILDPTLMHIAFVFILLGFGTKMGLFPMHAWLPDAHSEAPSPASALLSAVLLNCALLVVLRYFIVITGVIGDSFPKTLLLILGFLSVGFAAFFIIVQRDIKRLLAYSSVENMGLIAIAIAIGGPLGTFAALLHAINHSLAKTLLFCGSGNILLKYGTRDMSVVKGLLKIAPLTSVLFIAGALALGGMPPFNVFVSEFMLVLASIQAGSIWLTLLLLLLLTVVLGGLVRMASKVSFGTPPEAVSKGELGFMTIAPMAILLVLMLLMGTYIPQSVKDYIHRATDLIMVQPQSELITVHKQPVSNRIDLSKLELASLRQESAQ